MIYDYYNKEEYEQYFQDFLGTITDYCTPNEFKDIYLNYLSLSDFKEKKAS